MNLECPMTHERFVDPVIARDGITYERASIEEWFLSNDTSPMTGVVLEDKALIPNVALRNLVDRLP